MQLKNIKKKAIDEVIYVIVCVLKEYKYWASTIYLPFLLLQGEIFIDAKLILVAIVMVCIRGRGDTHAMGRAAR